MLNTAKPSVPPETLNVNPASPDLIFYGPQPCGNCRRLVCKTSLEQGAIPFDYPQGEPIYPNTKWNRHVCQPSAGMASGPDVKMAEVSMNERLVNFHLRSLRGRVLNVIDGIFPQGTQNTAVRKIVVSEFDEQFDRVSHYFGHDTMECCSADTESESL